MKKALIIGALIVLIVVSGTYTIESLYKSKEYAYQNDADLIRLEHLVYWSGLIEEYHKKTGYYPFQNQLVSEEQPGLVRIATKNQQLYFKPKTDNYRKDLDNNPNKFFQEFTVKEFVSELENKLGKSIDEKYDIQKVPTSSPIWYNYFVTNEGYLIWVPCINCGVTKISTLLMDGITPTVNIASSEMKKNVTKALTREEMMNHPIFKDWQHNEYAKETYIRNLEQQNFQDSKH